MNYEFTLPDGRVIGVLETPELVHPDDLFDAAERDGWALRSGQPGLMRSFLASELPANVKLALAVRTDHVVGKFCELEERASSESSKPLEGPGVMRSYTHVVLNAEKRANNFILFFAPMPDAPNVNREPKK
jgi:hypothetical protein